MKQASVIVLAGQSNAVGVGFSKYLPKHFSPERVAGLNRGYEHIRINYVSHDIRSQGFVPTTLHCTELTKETFGPELGMAEYLSEACPDEAFFIVKCAFGGSDMFNGWRSPSTGVPYCPELIPDPPKALVDPAYQFPGWCYNALIKLLEESFALLCKEGYTPVVKGFCWMQGEADAAPPHAEPYIERYAAMLRDITTAFAHNFEDCVFVDAGISEVWTDYQAMNQRKKAYAEAHGHRFVDTVGAGLTTSHEPEEAPDLYHYDADSTLLLGRMFAEAVLSEPV